MNDFRYFTPTEVVFGKDAENKTGDTAKKYGSKALLVYGKGSVIKSGLLDRVKASLEKAGVQYKDFGGAKPNPTLAHAEEGVKEALSFGADMIIGVGGGSTIVLPRPLPTEPQTRIRISGIYGPERWIS
jgi:hypothetical protein